MKSKYLAALALQIRFSMLPALPPSALIVLLKMTHLISVLSAQESLA
jgi:hypothetical protein